MALARNRGARAGPCDPGGGLVSGGVLDPAGWQRIERSPDNLNNEQLKRGAREQC